MMRKAGTVSYLLGQSHECLTKDVPECCEIQLNPIQENLMASLFLCITSSNLCMWANYW